MLRSIQVTQLVSVELGLEFGLSKFGACPSSISITLELVSGANFRPHPRPTESETLAWGPEICVGEPSLMVLTHAEVWE